MTGSGHARSARRVLAASLILGTVGAALLSVDNLLGFTGAHLLSPPLAPVVAIVTAVAASVAAVGGALARDLARLLVAVAVVGFVATGSPASSIQLWFPVAVVLQALVPLKFAAAGLVFRRRPHRSVTERALAALLVGFALAWTITAFVPVALVPFLVLQAGTLLVAVTLSLQPVRDWCRNLARELWSSADVR